jgi:hypothetical protein
MGIILLEIESDEPDELEQLAKKMMEKLPVKISARVSHYTWLQWPGREREIIEMMKSMIESLNEDGPQSLS